MFRVSSPASLPGCRRAAGQSTAEYALVILGAVALATLLISWATGTHSISKLFDTVIGKVLPG